MCLGIAPFMPLQYVHANSIAGALRTYLEPLLPVPLQVIYPGLIAGHTVLSIHLTCTWKGFENLSMHCNWSNT